MNPTNVYARILFLNPGLKNLFQSQQTVLRFSENLHLLTDRKHFFISGLIGSQTLHTTVTSFFRSLHTKGKNCHFIPVTSYQVTSYKAILHTSHFIPSHFIPRSLHTSHFIPKSLHTNHFIPGTLYQSHFIHPWTKMFPDMGLEAIFRISYHLYRFLND